MLRRASRSRRIPAPACTPRQNHILAALPAEDYERLLPAMELVPLALNQTIHHANESEHFLYFPVRGVVTKFCITAGGACLEYAVTGCEGVIGIAVLLGGDRTPSEAVVTSPGHAYRMPATQITSELDRNSPLRRLMLRFTLALIGQIGQTAVCNRHHTLNQRLCLWLLLCLDRLSSNDLEITQDLLARMLGVRREAITEAAGNLKKAGLVRYSRGHFTILDRKGLEAQACECYEMVKGEYRKLSAYLETGPH